MFRNIMTFAALFGQSVEGKKNKFSLNLVVVFYCYFDLNIQQNLLNSSP